MQVRKFEAKTIKEAIDLVKFHLGPEAIILSAKDNGKNFGLMGETSVEVTAAVSDLKLIQKQAAEKKLNTRNKAQYQGSSARAQKEYIEKVFTNHRDAATFEENNIVQENKMALARASVPKTNGITSARYADITEDGTVENKPQPVAAAINYTPSRPAATVKSNSEVESLQNEIQHLRSMLSKFQSVPQNIITYHPGAEEGLPYELSFVFKKLLDAGMKHENIAEILKIANEVLPNEHKKKKAFVDGWVIKYLLEHIHTVEKPFKSKYQVFVGPTGQGKTSTVVKIACHLMMNEKKKVAILSGDHVKVGAADQLKTYAQIMNVPCGRITKQSDWPKIQAALENIDYVLLDTPGVNLRSEQDYEILKSVLPQNMPDMQVHYVQSCVARDLDAFEVAERFHFTKFQDVIFTRLDESVQHGIIYNFQKHFKVPLHSFGIGSGMPEDYELATKERLVDLLFNLSKIKKERG
jgi:flagellar biosynthesis protein FlhF